MGRVTFVSMMAGWLLTACGGQAVPGGEAPNDPASASNGGTGSLTVMSDRPAAGASSYSYKRSVTFTPAGPAACAITNVGACQVDPCYVTKASQAGTLPSAGEVSILGAEMAALALDPTANGSYASVNVDGELPWETGGETVTFGWAHLPGDAAQAGGQVRMATPPYIALSAGSPFAATTSTLSRAADLTLSWTSDSPPAALDQVLVDLSSANGGGAFPALATRLVCQFKASAGQGIVPAAALQSLGAGKGTFDVHSKEYLSETLDDANGAQWDMQFNVDAHARTDSGLATGSVTFE